MGRWFIFGSFVFISGQSMDKTIGKTEQMPFTIMMKQSAITLSCEIDDMQF